MAITYRTSAAGGGTSGTGNRTVTITPAVGDLFVVFCSASGNTNVSPTCSDNNGGTYSLILSGLWSSSANSFSCFVRNEILPNTTSTVITVATGSNTAAELVVVAVSGSHRTGSSAVRSSGKQENQAASTTPTPVLNQNALTGNMTLAAVASGDTTTTPNASWTERQDVSQSTPTTALEVCTRDSGFTGTSIAFGATQSTVFGSMAIELDGTWPPLTAELGAFAETGNNSGLLRGLIIVAAHGSYVETGIAATLAHGYSLSAGAGLYALTGVATGLIHAARLAADFGAYTEAGIDATLLHGYAIQGALGQFSLTGIDASLVYTPGGGGVTLTADAASYALTGTTTGLTVQRTLTATTRTYALAGIATGLSSGRRLTADTRSHSLVGVTTQLLAGKRLTAALGTYGLTGIASAFATGKGMAAAGGTLSLTAPITSLRASRRLTSELGTYSLGSLATVLRLGRTLVATPRSYSLNTTATAFSIGRYLAAGIGTFDLFGIDATLLVTLVFVGQPNMEASVVPIYKSTSTVSRVSNATMTVRRV